MLDSVLLRRKNLVNISEAESNQTPGADEICLVVTTLKNMESLGYTLSNELFKKILQYPTDKIKEICKELISKLKDIVGDNIVYKPMYPNFPQQVMNATDAELVYNALLHYWSSGEWIPQYSEELKKPLLDKVDLTVLNVGTDQDSLDIFNNLVASKTNLSQQDKDDIENLFVNYISWNYDNLLPEEIPFKETAAFICKLIYEQTVFRYDEPKICYIQKYIKTATDVLRFVTALSNGDVSLATPTKYRKFSRPDRRLIMDLLASCNEMTILEDMWRYRNEWIRIGEIIHPGEYKQEKYKYINAAFRSLRNHHKPLFYPGLIQDSIQRGDMEDAAEMLTQRPGEFARHLDKLLREDSNIPYILEQFKSVADKVSTPVLLQVHEHFNQRSEENLIGGGPNDIRVFFPKGNAARAYSVANELPPISQKTCYDVMGICWTALVKRYGERESLGKVYVDKSLTRYTVPFSQRSANSGKKILTRGSRIKVGQNCSTIRSFIWWTNQDNNHDYWWNKVDLDLSAVVFDENWKYVNHISWTHLRDSEIKSYHSGDIVDGGPVDGKGASEFLDIDIESVKKQGRYVVFQIFSYSGQKFSELQNCKFGWMERQDVNSGEIYEPSTVEMCMTVTSNTDSCIPVIFDCVKKEYIWCDLNTTVADRPGRMVENTLDSAVAACYAMVNIKKPSLYTLALANAFGRGTLVSHRAEADIIFSDNPTKPTYPVTTYTYDVDNYVLTGCETHYVEKDVKVVTPFDIDYIMGQLL
jgi:stress response protein SCP2